MAAFAAGSLPRPAPYVPFKPLALAAAVAIVAASSLITAPALGQSSGGARSDASTPLIDSAAFLPPAPPTVAVEWASPEPPAAPREFRGAWVASVANIDWPSRPGLSVWEQKLELIQLLNRAADLNLNAVIFQVRPAADALYDSKYEPWSEYLTGQMGRAPQPYYDPLAFAVREAHARGLELHAWFNPFRARHDTPLSEASRTHVSRTHPRLVRRYGKFLWMDPGEPAVQARSLRAILDVVRRYDVDGVHIDDYFYPYREYDRRGRLVQFPDDASWARYRRRGGRLPRDDWRRQNVDTFVRRMYREVKAAKPWVKVGVSPFGIWRPGYPAQVRGLDAYRELFADSRKWVANGWLDYVVPQLYWPVAQTAQSYPVLLHWWAEQNAKGRHLWAGNFTSRAAGLASPVWGTGELLEQVRLTRAEPGASGNVHFSMKALMPRPLTGPARPLPDAAAAVAGAASDTAPASGMSAAAAVGAGALPRMLGEQLRIGPYASPALVPASPWLSRARPASPRARTRPDSSTGGLLLTITPSGRQPVRRWVVRARYDDRWTLTLLPQSQRQLLLAGGTPGERSANPDAILVTAVDRFGNESEVVQAASGERQGRRKSKRQRQRSVVRDQ